MPARIVVTEFVSLDGVMEAPGGEEFKYPGWSFEFDRGDDGNQFKLQETMQADAILIGKRTYESFAGAWPQREGPFAEKFNSMPKFVVSTTLKDPEWNNTTVLDSGNATAQVRKLKEEFDGELQVPGSNQLVQELIEVEELDGHVVVSMYQRGRGKASGAEVENQITHVWTLRDGVAIALRSFADHDEGVGYARS